MTISIEEYKAFAKGLNDNFDHLLNKQLRGETLSPKEKDWMQWRFQAPPSSWTTSNFYVQTVFSKKVTTILHNLVKMQPNYCHKDAIYCCNFLAQKAVHLFATVDIRDTSCVTPLMEAAYTCQVVGIAILMNFKADPNLKDNEGATALHYLLHSNKPYDAKKKALDFLIQKGADSENLSTIKHSKLNPKGHSTDEIKKLIDEFN